MKAWDRLLAPLRRSLRHGLRQRPGSGSRYYKLDEPLQNALEQRADLERRPVEKIQAELLAAGLDALRTADDLMQRWETLSPREQQVTALTCLGYTNRQIAASLRLSPTTVKDYVSDALLKWHVPSKEELRLLLVRWDFNEWRAPTEKNV